MKTKKILASLLVLVMLVMLMPQAILAAGPVSIDLSTVASGGNGYTCEEIIVNGKTEYVVTITAPGDYELTGTVIQTATQYDHPTHVIVSAAEANITLNNVSITLLNFSPLAIKSGSSVNLTLAAGTENTLSLGTSEVAVAGLSVPAGASVVIGGTGKLIARGGSAGNGAGIGGGANQFVPDPIYNRNAGTITINSGVIDALGGPAAAGIGGASNGNSSLNGGIITINGGEVTAKSPYYYATAVGAGIGGGYLGGGDITINGGTVIAQGGDGQVDAIGSGDSWSGSTVKILGGSVRTLSPMRIRSTPRNASANVYLTTVTVQDNSSNPLSSTELSCQVGATSFTAKTDSAGKLYLWLPEGNSTIIVSSGDAIYRAVGTVLTDDSATLATVEFNPCAEVNGTMYETWTEAVSAVQVYQTITLLKDLSLSSSDQMPAVACTIDGGTSKHKLTLDGQSLQADITLKDLNLESTNTDLLECAGYHLRILGTVGTEGDINLANGLELNIDGNLEIGGYGEINGFNNLSVSAGSSVTAFALRTTSATIDGTVTCKYFRLGNVSGSPGVMGGNGQFIFTNTGGESANIIIAANSSILSNARITLRASGYTPFDGQMLVEAANGNLDRFILGSGYSGFKLKYIDENKGYILKESIPLKTPSVSLSPDTENGGLIYTITPAADETGIVSGYMLQLLGSDGTTEVGGAITCDSASGMIPLSSVVLSGSSYRAKVKAIAEVDSDYTDSSYSAACAAVQAANALGNTNADAVAAAKEAIVGGTVNVAYGATQEQKTAAVQSYVDGIISNTASAAGVTATVTHSSGNQYNVALSKGGASDSKTIAMTVNEAAAPATVTSVTIKTAPTKTTYTAGDALDLSGLVVTLHKSDSSTQDVAFADFGTNSITVSPANGAILITGDGSVTITHTASGQSASQSITVNPTPDTTPPTISPTSRNYDLINPADITTAITWNSAASVTDVVYGTDHLITLDAVTISGDILTIKNSYLSSLTLMTGAVLDFDISFDTGATAMLTVNVVDNYTPSTDATLSDLAVNGTPVSGFDPNTNSYDVELSYGSSSAAVTATASDPNAQVSITQASSLPGYTTVTVTAEDGITTKTYTIHLTIGAAPVTRYTVTASAGSGGSISPSGAVNVMSGGSQTFTITPNSGYRINTVTVDGVSQGAISTYTFTNVTANHMINAAFTGTSSGGGDGGDGGSSPSGGSSGSTTTAPPTPEYKADVDAGSGSDTTLPVTVDKNSGSATVDVGTGGNLMSGGKTIVVTVPSVPDVDTYTLGVPVPNLTTLDKQGEIAFKTNNGSVTIPSNMLTGVEGISGSKAQISIGQGDKENLPEDVKVAIGDRPLVQLTLSIDGKQTDWNNANAPVTVSIPYTPTAAELANPESIVVWYIDGSGKAVSVPNGRYDAATGTVTFNTTHFSDYAVAYNKVSFNDVAAGAWYNKAVSFIAARKITTGTGNGNYSPNAKLTRGEFIVMLLKAYDIAPDTNPKDNFTDAGNTYYTGYLATAKRLGISEGVGNNMYAPNKEITRQEMFALLYNALKVIGQLPQGDSGKTILDFSDTTQISDWARESMATFVVTGTVGGGNGKLTPTGTTTRAEMAQVLYNLLGK